MEKIVSEYYQTSDNSNQKNKEINISKTKY